MKNISLEEYQALAEENQRLRTDLKTICMGDTADSIEVRQRWRKVFTQEDLFSSALKNVLNKKDKSNGKQ